jgi:hypothetical protein
MKECLTSIDSTVSRGQESTAPFSGKPHLIRDTGHVRCRDQHGNAAHVSRDQLLGPVARCIVVWEGEGSIGRDVFSDCQGGVVHMLLRLK